MLGCATNLLVRPDDATHARAMTRLSQTAARLDQSGASDVERLLFLQAESLYRYRFTPPQPGAGAVLASIAAVAIELPALQSVAGSFDLLELRLRAADGAIQLWETLLDRFPHSVLRPWAMYRLGWAYRSAVTRGFPHQSPEELFDALSNTELATLAAQAREVPRKSPGVATALSLIPGGGQLYPGELINGLVRLDAALVAASAILVPVALAWQRREELSWKNDWPLLLSGLLGAIVLSVDYALSYQDALRAVMQFNERSEEIFEAAHPAAP
jgi:hypothetical protein